MLPWRRFLSKCYRNPNLCVRRLAALQMLEDQGMLKKGTRQRLEERKYPKALEALGVARADLQSLAAQS